MATPATLAHSEVGYGEEATQTSEPIGAGPSSSALTPTANTSAALVNNDPGPVYATTTTTPSIKQEFSLPQLDNHTSSHAVANDASPEKRGELQTASALSPIGHHTRHPSLPASPAASNTAIDPLSQHIFLRTNTERNIASRLRNAASKPDVSPSDGIGLHGDTTTDLPDKKSRPRPSFLARFSMRANKLRNEDDDADSDSEAGLHRPDGNNARVFATTIGAQGYIPHHKEPPRYIRTKAYHKKQRDFDRMFLAQELIGTRPLSQNSKAADDDSKAPFVTVSSADGADKRAERTGGAIWAAQFSRDGRYLAAAGKDQVVRVWAVISTPEERRMREDEEEALLRHSSGVSTGGGRERLSAPVFRDQPVREFEGHSGEILDLSWSKNNFLLSTSMDRTVRLWHVSRRECLCTFRHGEFVSKVAFHPRDDRFFLAGCLDARLRLWSIPDKAVAFEAQTNDMITAVAFSPDGTTAIAGLLSGVCKFYETEGLKFRSLLHVRSSRGKNAKGSKITGIRTAEVPSSSSKTSETKVTKVLVTSTDARVRIYNLTEKTLDVKFKGHEHTAAQLSASFSDDGSYVICPSEHHKVFIWSLAQPQQHRTSAAPSAGSGGLGMIDSAKGGDKGPCECFTAHGSGVTAAIFAPTETRRLLGASGDPIYDLCNPPPVTLISREEEAAATVTASTRARDTSPSVQTATHNMSQTALSEVASVTRTNKRAEESPGYIARSAHHDGNIIVTADDTGVIKVFRQDCAYRRRRDGPETASMLTRKRDSIVGRSASILTRTSVSSAPHSRRGSVSRPMVSTMVDGSSSHPYGAMSDQILDWRQRVEADGGSNSSRTNSIKSPTIASARPERSVSPTKSTTARSSVTNLASERRREQYGYSSSPLAPRAAVREGPTSPSESTFSRSNRLSAAPVVHHALPEPSATDAKVTARALSSTSNYRDSAQEMMANDSTPGPMSEAHLPESPPGDVAPPSTSGFWSLKWPRIPTLRMSIGGAASKELGGSGASSNGTAPDGLPVRQSSESAITRDPKVREQKTKGDNDKGKDKEKKAPQTEARGSLDPSHLPDLRENGNLSKLMDSGDEMECRECGAKEFKAKKGGGGKQQSQWLVCAKCAAPAVDH